MQKIKKSGGGGCQGIILRISYCENAKKKYGGLGYLGPVGDGAQGGCVPKIEVIVKMQKKIWVGVGW